MPPLRRVRPALALALTALACAGLAACGADTGDDAPEIDARPADAAVPDAEVDRCVTLCECVADFCAGEVAACMTTCATLDDSVIECRVEHCGYAQTNPSFHCPHANGEVGSPGVPAACLQD